MKTTDFIKENKFIGDDAHAMHQDHEVQMARSDCYNAAKYAIELHKLLKNISEMEGLDGWVSEKITLANDYLRTVAEYLRHEAVMADQGLPEMFTAESAEARFDQLLSEESTGVAEGSENLAIGEKMARDGIEYDPAREGEIISMIGDYLRRDGMTTRQVRGYMIDPDFISDQLSYLPRKSGVTETTSAGGIATVPGVGGGPKVGSLFGGSYSPKTPFTGKKKAKESVIKR